MKFTYDVELYTGDPINISKYQINKRFGKIKNKRYNFLWIPSFRKISDYKYIHMSEFARVSTVRFVDPKGMHSEFFGDIYTIPIYKD